MKEAIKKVLLWLLGLLVIVIVIGVITLFIRFPFEKSEDEIPAAEIQFHEIALCEADSDCIVVDRDHCCGSTKYAINKEHLNLYDSKTEWQSVNDPQICSIIAQCADDSYVTQATCENDGLEKRCILVY